MRIRATNIKEPLKQIFTRPSAYLLVALGLFLIIAVAVILPNHEFGWYIITSENPISFKFKLYALQFLGFSTMFTPTLQVFLIMIGLLTGLNFAILVHYFKNRITLQKSAGMSAFGIVSGVFGVGCSACGSVILSSLVGLTASSQIVGALPLKGYEFSILSTIVLIGANLFLLYKMSKPVTCAIPIKTN